MELTVLDRGELEKVLKDLKVYDERSYYMTYRALSLIALMRSSCCAWYDTMVFDIAVEHCLARIHNDQLKETIKVLYQQVLSEVARDGVGQDGYEMRFDPFTGRCPLCSK